MSIKYIGRTTNFRGKTLWEIVGNLKNYGIGRVVVRSVFERYPEPSFMKIIKVETLSNEHPRKVKVWVDRTFRGRHIPEPIVVNSVSYKADYRLLPKEQEADYCKITRSVSEKAVPTKLEFPPLLKEYISREYNKKGMQFDENSTLNLTYGKTKNTTVCVTEESKKLPAYKIGLTDPVNKALYNDIPV